ncbi:triose-phosphate isomerase, partial [Candidatus Bathyarchaeota archaeon]
MEAKKMGTPVIVLNMKSYAESAGRRGFELAKICEDVASKQGVNIAICPQ